MLKGRKECLMEYGSDYMIQKKLDSGELFQVEKAIYSDKKNVPEIAIYAYMYPNAVLTMDTAFYYYNLTDVIPEAYDFATDRNAAKIKNKKIRQHFIASDFFEQGIEVEDYKGYPIRIYSKERMLIELLRFKTKLPYDYYKEILLNYRKILPRLNIQTIQDFARRVPNSKKIIEMLQTEVM